MARNELADWSELRISDLFFAYRKAKVDCFYETSIRVAERFVEYEQKLAENLAALLVRLQMGEAHLVLAEGAGEPIIFPKRLHFAAAANQPADETAAHAFFSDAERAFGRAAEGKLVPEFRLIGDFTVECHIMSALWVNLIGHKFDARLSPHALAARVRRYRADKDRGAIGGYHREALGSFEPYFQPYRKWRDDGIRAMRDAIEREQPIIAMTLDVGNFYHSIDPAFFIDERFLAYLKLELTAFERAFTGVFSAALVDWSMRCRMKLSDLGCASDSLRSGGIPIGLSIVRVVSNVVLAFLDEQVERQLSPIYYARYVDDLFLVLHDSAEIRSPADLWRFITQRVPAFTRAPGGNVTLALPEWGGGTQLTLQAAKQKTFFLSGRSGADLLDHIASQIRDVSSERRTMPLPEHIERSQAARALAATDSTEDADSLRRADGLTLRRLGWSVLLRAVNTLARDLRAPDWKTQRNEFYEFAHEHVIRADKVLEQIDHLPRLLSLAVSLSDWVQARRIYSRTVKAIYDLQRATVGAPMQINGHEAAAVKAEVWDDTRVQVRRFFREALIRAYPPGSATARARALSGLLADLELAPGEIETLALRTREADWARVPYREHLRTAAVRQPPEQANESLLAGCYARTERLRQFLRRTQRATGAPPPRRVAPAAAATDVDDPRPRSLLPFLFPIRPYTPEEIALYLPRECVFDEPVEAAHAWAEYTRAVRGVWVRGDLADEMEPIRDAYVAAGASDGADDTGESDDSRDGIPPIDGDPGAASKPLPPVIVKQTLPGRPVRLGLTSFEVTDDSWAKGAAGTPDVSPDRYWRLARIVNAAITAHPKPDYLILPELSVPDEWIGTITGRLRESGISLIAGLDYTRHPGGTIDSSALLALTDDRLGYPSSIQVRQRKSLPAPGEDYQLNASHGLSWTTGASVKRVYQHNGLYFGILVCSELQNMAYRAAFQGQIDCMITLSWNKDLDSFSALIDAAALDVHAYVVLVNNRRYGDSRLRRPAKQSFKRDVCRVRGGLNDQLVIVDIEPTRLRQQQSRAKRWPREKDAYKPTPEGFVISDQRACIPD